MLKLPYINFQNICLIQIIEQGNYKRKTSILRYNLVKKIHRRSLNGNMKTLGKHKIQISLPLLKHI